VVLLLTFLFIAYLLILFNILVDLFLRDHKTSGWVKAAWVIFLIFFPYLTALVYLIARGQAMAVRAREGVSAVSRSPAQEIADAKALLDAGTVTPEEFDSLKAHALGRIQNEPRRST